MVSVMNLLKSSFGSYLAEDPVTDQLLEQFIQAVAMGNDTYKLQEQIQDRLDTLMLCVAQGIIYSVKQRTKMREYAQKAVKGMSDDTPLEDTRPIPKTIGTIKELLYETFGDLDKLCRWGKELYTQDNLSTAHPIFMVQDRKRLYGLDTNYTDHISWCYEDECDEVDSEKAEELEKVYQDTLDEPAGFRRLGYIDTWENVQPFFTRNGADQYLKVNSHNLSPQARVYVESAHRNGEWQAVRGFLARLAMVCKKEETLDK
jgi:hypothetical protein